MKYSVQSKDYLSRARRERDSNDISRLFYSAYELRAGVEARLHEYRDCLRNEKRDNIWKVRILKREIENISDRFEKPVTIHLYNPITSQRTALRYVPITDELKNIAERLGSYLHCLPTNKVRQHKNMDELTSLVDRGIVLLKEAVSGELLSPPMFKKSEMRAIFNFDIGKMPEFLMDGGDVRFEATFIVESKDDEGITLKIT
jgi:hypothetical protein